MRHESISGLGTEVFWFSPNTKKILDQLRVADAHKRIGIFGLSVLITEVVPRDEFWLVTTKNGFPQIIKKFVLKE